MSVVKTIAENLGISPSTVSLVLNNKPGISESTRNKVFEKLDELGFGNYVPRSAMKNKPSIQLVFYKKHGIILSDAQFFTYVLEGIELQVRQSGYNLLVSYVYEQRNGKPIGIEEQIQELLGTNCQGFILLATEMNIDDLVPFKRLGIPFVVLDSYFEDVNIDSVVINNVQGAFLAIKYLYEQGHTEIGYLASKVVINNFLERKEGYKKALKAINVPYNNEFVLQVAPTMELAYQDMKEFIQLGKKMPTAFFADNDTIAIGAAKAIRESGLRIPEDISIVGFDDIPLCEVFDPPLTTIKVPKQTMGKLAVNRLTYIIENKDGVYTKTEVFTELVTRLSTKAL